jgi:hypothetical protein
LGHLTWGDIVGILGSLASIFAGVRILLGFYFKQQMKLDAARKTAFVAQAALLKREMDDFKTQVGLDITAINDRLDELVAKFDWILKEYQDSKVQTDKVYEAFRKYVAEVRERLKKYESHQDPEAYNKIEPQQEEEPKAKSKLGKVLVKP